MRPTEWLCQCWLVLREITGDDAYERYHAHWRRYHAGDGVELLSREAFFKQELERKWNGATLQLRNLEGLIDPPCFPHIYRCFLIRS
ncbi:MAG: YbdD/YjiX family protein [Methylococcaceae bacterium]|nr:YbdD/YjiX family protein [Methylococcaceae bacterium]